MLNAHNVVILLDIAIIQGSLALGLVIGVIIKGCGRH